MMDGHSGSQFYDPAVATARKTSGNDPSGTTFDPADVFDRGGSAGDILRDIDWDANPMGAPAQWPQSLRTSLSLCLTSHYPICVVWGPSRTYFYNDAYAVIIGEKHPRALGRSFPDVWPEIWESAIRPLMEAVETSGTASPRENTRLMLQRHGYNEECYFEFSFAPIRLENGTVGGFFTAVSETTTQVVSERRLRTLRDLGVETASAKSVSEVCSVAAQVLGANRYDVPFALLYLRSADATGFDLTAAFGAEQAPQIAPARVAGDASWEFADFARHQAPWVVVDFAARFGQLVFEPWPEPVEKAVVLPIRRLGDELPYGFLVAGVSPRRRLDVEYQTFLSFAASQVATAVSNALIHQEAQTRAERLAELDRAKTAFFGNVSHEFRTPLTLMLGQVESVLRQPDTAVSPAAKADLAVAQRNSLRLLKLVNTLLDFSRIEAGRMHARYQPTNLAEYTAELASSFRSAVERAGLRLVIDCPPLSAPVYIDSEMWEKVVLNLVSNAFKFTLEGEIRVILRESGGVARLTVEDTGVGIPGNALPHLFERFFRVEGTRARSHEGSGIGLALVDELVRLHGGTIRAQSEPGKGSVFTLELPFGSSHLPSGWVETGREESPLPPRRGAFVQESAQWFAGVDETPGQSAQTEEAPAGAPRIVLADDNADMRRYVTRLLSPRYHVEAVADGAAALAAIRRERPHLVLADLMMPQLDGFGLLKTLRGDVAMRHLPVILLSARADADSQVEGLDAGADDYLVKPFSARELLARVAAHVELSRVRQESAQRLENTLESISDAFCTLDAQWRFGYVNSSYVRLVAPLYGTRESLLGRVVWEAFPDIVGTPIANFYKETMATQVAGTMEIFYEPLKVWLEVRAYPSPETLSVYVRDVTEQRKSAERLRQRSERMQLLSETLGQLLSAGDPKTVVCELFPKVAAHLGVDTYFNFMVGPEGNSLHLHSCAGIPEELTPSLQRIEFGQAICGTVAQLRKPIVAEDIQNSSYDKADLVRAIGIQTYACHPLLVGDRLLGTLSFASRNRPAFEPDELEFIRVVSRYAAVALDRLQSAAELRASERLYRAIGESINYGIWISDPEGRNLYSSESFLELVGLTQEEYAGHGWISVLHPEDAAAVSAAWPAASHSDSWERELRWKGVDGAWHSVLSRGVPVRGEDGAIVQWVGIHLDIADFKRSEAALSQQKRSLEILNRVGTTLSSNLDLHKVVQAVTDAGQEVSGAAVGVFFDDRAEADASASVQYAPAGAGVELLTAVAEFRLDPAFRSQASGKGVIRIDDLAGGEFAKEAQPSWKFRSLLSVPVVSRTGDPLGRLLFAHPEPRVFSEETERIVSGMAVQASIAMDNAKLYESVQKTADRLGLALSAGSLGDWSWDAATDVITLSERACEIYGVRRDQMSTRTEMRQLLHEHDRERARLALAASVQSRTDYDIEYRVIRAGGEQRWVAARGRATYAADGALTGMLGVVQDITARKQSEEELNDARTRVEATLGAAEIGTWIWDIEADRVLADKNMARMFAMPPNDVAIGPVARFVDVIHPDDRERAEAEISAALNSPTGELNVDYRLVIGKGAIRWVTARGKVERDGAGRPVKFPGVVIDITERKEQERVLSELSREIADQAHLFDATLSHIADLAYTFDREARVIYANKPLLDLWGRTLEQVVGKNCYDLGYPQELADKLHGELLEVVRTGKAFRGETPFESAAGVVEVHEYIYNPVYGTDGIVVAVAGTTRLVTERKRVEAALKEAKEAAEAASLAKDRFLAVLSHELRTPLNPVLMAAAALELEPALPPEFKDDITMIRRNVELETKLIDDLLDLSRITSGKLALRAERVDLNELVNEVCAICRAQILEKSIRLECGIDPTVGHVNADPARLQQVLWNVIKNAVKFTPQGGRIEVITRRVDEGHVQVEVSDSGMGIAPEVLPVIFEAFEQGDGKITRQFGGLGLGLAITKALIELHGGWIFATSAGVGQGATFIVNLPGHISAAKARPDRELLDRRPDPTQLRLLVVEDHGDTARTLGRLLGKAGFRVTIANSVTAALDLASGEPFDVMVSDIGLPDGTGYDLMRQVRERFSMPGIAMSGYGMEEDHRKSREAGFTEHLVKPVSMSILTQTIRRLGIQPQPREGFPNAD